MCTVVGCNYIYKISQEKNVPAVRTHLLQYTKKVVPQKQGIISTTYRIYETPMKKNCLCVAQPSAGGGGCQDPCSEVAK